MSLSKKLVLIGLSFGFFSLSYASYSLFTKSENPKRAFSVHKSGFTQQNKLEVINIDVSETEPAEMGNQVSNVKAAVSLKNVVVSELNYKWILGEGVELVRGERQGSISLNDTEVNLSIAVRGFTKQANRHVALRITGLKDGQRFVAEKLLASQIENSFEKIVQNVEKIKAEEKKD